MITFQAGYFHDQTGAITPLDPSVFSGGEIVSPISFGPHGVGGFQDDDWIIFDLGETVSLETVTLDLAGITGESGVDIYLTAAMPAAHSVTPSGDPSGSVDLLADLSYGSSNAGLVVATDTALSGRYLSLVGTGFEQQLAGISAAQFLPPAPAAPSLTATAQIVAGVPAVILTGN